MLSSIKPSNQQSTVMTVNYRISSLSRGFVNCLGQEKHQYIYEFPESFWMCIENLKCVALAVPEIIAIGVLVGSCEP